MVNSLSAAHWSSAGAALALASAVSCWPGGPVRHRLAALLPRGGGDPRQRTRTMLLAVDPQQPLVALLEGHASGPKFTGPGPWLAVVREKKS